ncbi:MAG TPA: ABC transporter ATP-binding protein [Thermomicrobiales bacterium]|nr:ABC transporter ATP-binding protein [Thermomicrobiales bacterium]
MTLSASSHPVTHDPSPNTFVPPAVAMRDISKRFGPVVASDHVDFEASWGEVHALIGENGAGKSTLMSILAGLYRPDSGQVEIDGMPVRLRSPRDAIARGIGMVYQHFMLIDPFTVTENVVLGEQRSGVDLQTVRVERELDTLSERYGLYVDPRARIWQLSVGEQQRVEILRLLYLGARILVFDEPTAVLTPQESQSLLQTLRGMAAQGFSIVFISHKLDEVLEVADRVSVLRRGQIVGTTRADETDRRTLARLMVGRELADFVEHPADEPHEAVTPGSTVLELRGVNALGDKGVPALRGVDLEVRAGETVGIAGVAGNGQRELAEIVTGLRPVTEGAVRIDGKTMTNRPAAEIARAGVAHIPEDRLATGLIGGMDLSENAILREYAQPPLCSGPFLSSKAVAAFSDRLIADHDVKTPGRWAKLRTLSGGNQQKLLLARELAGQPRLIVAVHPTRGVDVGATEAIHDALRKQRARGAATLLISEDLDELLALSDRIAVLFDGRVMGVLPARGANPEEIGLLMAGVGSRELDVGTDV